MKRILPILLAAVLMLSISADGGPYARAAENTPDSQIRVVSTIFPGYDFTRAVAGDSVEVTMLLPPGSESHSFEPTPQDILKIQNCDVFLYVGGESDTWVDGILDSMDTSHMTILPMMDLVETLEEEIKEGMEEDHEHAEEEHAEEEHEYDEHVWTSPVNAMVITQAIADALSALDPDQTHAEAYQSRCAAYLAQLKALDAAFREVVQNAPRHTLVFGDRFPFRYLVAEYGLDYYAAFPGCSTETEPSAKTVAFLMDKVKAESIPVVFHIEFSNEKMADTLCESTGAKKLLLHSCHNLTKADFESGVTYLELMAQNVEALKEALH